MDFGDCIYGISIAVKLSDAIIDEITDTPTHTYFHHYRTVNTFIDQTLLKLGIYLEQKGYRYITVGASQSINLNGWNYNGRYSHKKLACLAGMGTIGKSSLFLHKEYGARVRLGSLFTNCPVSFQNHAPVSICKDCTLADTYATAFANEIKTTDDVAPCVEKIGKTQEILAAICIKDDKIGIHGIFDLKLFHSKL